MLRPPPPLRTIVFTVLLAVSAGVAVAPLLGTDTSLPDRVGLALLIATAAILGGMVGRWRSNRP